MRLLPFGFKKGGSSVEELQDGQPSEGGGVVSRSTVVTVEHLVDSKTILGGFNEKMNTMPSGMPSTLDGL